MDQTCQNPEYEEKWKIEGGAEWRLNEQEGQET